MRAAQFDYHAPATIDDALELLARHGSDARILAGGQSLVPQMVHRLARPVHVIDINRCPGLERPKTIAERLRIPPLMRHVDFDDPVEDGVLGDLLSHLAGHVGALPVRLRGTFCGALAHADPASEWCLAVVTLNAELLIRSLRNGARTVKAEDFFASIWSTHLADDEMLVEVQIPLLSVFTTFGFHKVSHTANRFGDATALAVMERSDDLVESIKLGVGAVESTPRRLEEAERMLLGQRPHPALLREVADAAAEMIDPIEDDDLDTDYQRDLARTAVFRALQRASAE